MPAVREVFPRKKLLKIFSHIKELQSNKKEEFHELSIAPTSRTFLNSFFVYHSAIVSRLMCVCTSAKREREKLVVTRSKKVERKRKIIKKCKVNFAFRCQFILWNFYYICNIQFVYCELSEDYGLALS